MNATEDRMRLPLGGRGQRVVVERVKPLRLLRRRDPDDAAAVAGQGHEHAGALRRMEFGRDLMVRTRMGDVEGQRRLLQRPPAHTDAGRLAAQRMPPVGPDHQLRRQAASGARGDCDGIGIATHALGVLRDPRQLVDVSRPPLQRVDQDGIGDVVAEHVQTDLARNEAHFRRADQPAGIIDEPHRLEAGGAIAAQRPDAELVEKVDGAAEQGRCAIVRIGRLTGHERRARPGLRQGDGSR